MSSSRSNRFWLLLVGRKLTCYFAVSVECENSHSISSKKNRRKNRRNTPFRDGGVTESTVTPHHLDVDRGRSGTERGAQARSRARRAPRVTMRLTLKETAGLTPLQIAAMRVQLLNDEMKWPFKWVAPPDMLLGAGAGHRTAAQLYRACKQAWCLACQQRVSAEPANNCRAHGNVGVGGDTKHARSYASLMEKWAGLQSTMHAFAVQPAAVGGSAAAGGGGGGGPVSPIPAGSMSAPVRQMHADAVRKLRELEHCNLLGLGVNPHLVRYAATHTWCATLPPTPGALRWQRSAPGGG